MTPFCLQQPEEKKESQYVGLTWKLHAQKWQVMISENKKNVSVGYYENEIEAAKAYDKRTLAARGKDAKLNFPKKGQKVTIF